MGVDIISNSGSSTKMELNVPFAHIKFMEGNLMEGYCIAETYEWSGRLVSTKRSTLLALVTRMSQNLSTSLLEGPLTEKKKSFSNNGKRQDQNCACIMNRFKLK